MEFKKDREVIIVLGKTGFGKSLWGRVYTHDQSKFNRMLCYDPAMNFICNYRSSGDIIAEVLPENDDSYIWDRSQQPKYFRFGTYDPTDAESLGHAAFALGNTLFVVEEVSQVFRKGTATLPDYIGTLVFQGRHRDCNLLFLAQRPISVPIDLRTQANRVVSFQQHEGDDLNWLATFFGKENVAKLATLPKLSCIDYHNGVVMEYSIRDQVKSSLGITIDITPTEGVCL